MLNAGQILLLSPPLSYPLPLLSLTTHLALLSTRLPCLRSEGEEDPFFDDDWDAAVHLYPRHPATATATEAVGQNIPHPPVTLLVMTAGENIIFDPTREELAVAEGVLAISVAAATADKGGDKTGMRLLAIRTIDPPSRLTPPGVPDTENSTTGTETRGAQGSAKENVKKEGGVWTPPRGGITRQTIGRIIKMVLEKGGVAEEVMAGLEGVDVG